MSRQLLPAMMKQRGGGGQVLTKTITVGVCVCVCWGAEGGGGVQTNLQLVLLFLDRVTLCLTPRLKAELCQARPLLADKQRILSLLAHLSLLQPAVRVTNK